METFECSSQGGMRRGTKTNSLVLISNHVKSIYEDIWIDNVFHCTGVYTNLLHFIEKMNVRKIYSE
ncbi:hypothetical protein [Clostridium beijerinckii]|uniref:hypothetical protein n=1 Tax=Clostridium beijerinckii TaxID=1520 RepID=UPI000A1C7987|nr:hypothetical protein [Clostridium beijerinckii]CUU48431.1 protein of unknown function [Clostridium beijerinckii]